MINYSEEWIVPLIFRLNGSVSVRACMFAVPSTMLAFLLVFLEDFVVPGFREALGLTTLRYSQLWTASMGVLTILLAFRTNRAMARFWEGTGLLHQMRGEWFDSVSCCVTFSRAAVCQKHDEVMSFRHTIVRLMSLLHGSALEEIAGTDAEECETIDSFGLNNQTLQHLKECKEVHEFNRVEVLLHLIQSLITKALDDGVLKIPPPILSRVYQTLSRGFVNLLNAKKIADTRFPFPYVQLITMLLCLHVLLTPFVLSSILTSYIWAPLFTFVPMFGMFSLNFIGVELENPFGNDANDLPLDHFQAEMNKCLMMLLQENADLIAGISESRCQRDFDKIKSMLTTSEKDTSGSGIGGRMASRRLSQFADYVDIRADNDFFNGEIENPEDEEDTELNACLSQATSNSNRQKSPPAPGVEKTLSNQLVRIDMPPAPAPQEAAPPPSLPPERNQIVARVLEKSMLEFNAALQDLKRSVDMQALDLSRSISAVKDFSSALPVLLSSVIETREARERHQMKVNGFDPGDQLSSLLVRNAVNEDTSVPRSRDTGQSLGHGTGSQEYKPDIRYTSSGLPAPDIRSSPSPALHKPSGQVTQIRIVHTHSPSDS